MSTQNYSKEVIKNRMYRHAMDYWGVKKVENLDPLVKILFEALSCENFSLSRNQSVSHIGQNSHMLFLDILVSVRLAHSVIHVFLRDMLKYTIDIDFGFFVDIPPKWRTDFSRGI